MEQLQRAADVKVAATADGGAPYSLEEQCFWVFFFFARSTSVTEA